MIEAFLIVLVAVVVAINAIVIYHSNESKNEMADKFLVAMTDRENHFLDHIEHLETVNFQEAENNRAYRERIAHLQSERGRTAPTTENPHESQEDFEEFGGGNRRLNNQ